jgi:hypothetical protein
MLVLAQLCARTVSAENKAVNFQVGFSGHVDCFHPLALSNVPISGTGSGTLHPDGSVVAELTETAFNMLSTTIHFDARLGRVREAPGGTSEARALGPHQVRLSWRLPNNQLVVTINVANNTCTSDFAAILNRGKVEYMLFDGIGYHYCARPVFVTSSCEIH